MLKTHWQLGAQMNLLARHWVDEVLLEGMEHETLFVNATTVELVPQDGKAQAGQVYANLVLATGEEVHP